MQTAQFIEIFLAVVPLYIFAVALTIYNWKTKLFPNRFVIPAFVYFSFIRIVLGPGSSSSYIAGAALIFISLYAASELYLRFQGRAVIGGGDIKFLTTIGMGLGWISSLIILAVAIIGILAFMTRPDWDKRGGIPTGGLYLMGVTTALLITYAGL